MKKTVRKILRIFYIAVFIVIVAYVAGMAFYPRIVTKIIPYQFYSVLTDSMEPTIPTFSLVCSKVMDKDEELTKGDIITFEADRFGQDIILTHRFNKTEKDKKGNTVYRTNAEGEEALDMYLTKRSDILGKYVFHIPYLGKVFLFLKSPFGFIMYGEFLVVGLINMTIRNRWKEKDKKKEQGETLAEGIKQEQDATTIEH